MLKPDGSFFLNVGSTGVDPWIAMDVAAVFRDQFVLQNHIVWAKSVSIGDNTYGHFKPITSRRFLNHNYESIFHFTPAGDVKIDRLAVGVPFQDKSNINRWGHARDRRCAGNVWHIPFETVQSRADKFHHPAEFPLELPERCIKLHGGEDLVVLDPFVGAGTTMVAVAGSGIGRSGFECPFAVADLKALVAGEALGRTQHRQFGFEHGADGVTLGRFVAIFDNSISSGRASTAAVNRESKRSSWARSAPCWPGPMISFSRAR